MPGRVFNIVPVILGPLVPELVSRCMICLGRFDLVDQDVIFVLLRWGQILLLVDIRCAGELGRRLTLSCMSWAMVPFTVRYIFASPSPEEIVAGLTSDLPWGSRGGAGSPPRPSKHVQRLAGGEWVG